MLYWIEIFVEKYFEENKKMIICIIVFEGNLKDEIKYI